MGKENIYIYTHTQTHNEKVNHEEKSTIPTLAPPCLLEARTIEIHFPWSCSRTNDLSIVLIEQLLAHIQRMIYKKILKPFLRLSSENFDSSFPMVSVLASDKTI